ncbi:hypothetical protein VNI00_002749 [Paramarasmius palmivorus]|uniref:NACHT domain-containing protein n=1 Tax=Paramarasmius palmivorus TaxID=297713 RepID=A0AAW0DXF6_9AGAR
MAFNGSQVHVEGGANNVVHGDQINIVYSDEAKSRAFERLAQNAAPGACYDSEARFPPPNCHTGTRIQIIKKIVDWAEDTSRTASIFWLYGTAGLGKSAIAQHIAEKYAASGMLGGAFFFSRNDSTRDNIRPFVASLAYQFCKAGSPLRDALGPGIIEAICQDPNILSKTHNRQLQELILKPCSEVKRAKDHPKLLIVDGLDECISISEQERVLEILRELLAAPGFPSWIILLCSRPESQIRDAVKRLNFDGGLESFDMNSLEELNRDIETYFTTEFTRLRQKYQKALIREIPLWPGSHVVDELVRRADKQMIFAVTVIKYIDTRYDLPQNRLTRILRIRVDGDSNSPYEPLDALYNQILSTCYPWHKVQPILRLLVISYNLRSLPANTEWCRAYNDFTWRSPTMLAQLLEFDESEVAAVLDTLHSVLQIPRDYDANEDVSIAHATFTEFLVDPNRSTLYHTPRMPLAEYLQCLALFSLRILSDFARHYPPYHSQPHAEALSVWQEKIYDLDPALEVLLLVDIWPMVLQTVTSPSLDLLQALSKCDLYSLLGLMVAFKHEMRMGESGAAALGNLLVWAKFFGVESFPQAVEAFLSAGEFRLAFPPDAPAHEVLEECFETELLFWTDGGWLDWGLQEISLFTYPRLHFCDSKPLVLPPDCHSKHSMTIPVGWKAIHLTRANAQLWCRVYRAVKMNNGLSQLCEDIKDANRSETVSRGWVWEDDLIEFRKLVKERLRFAQSFPAEYEVGVDAETSFSWLYDGLPTTGTNRRTLVARNRYRTVPYPPR